MIYWILANGVLIIHLGFILFALFGGLLLFWRRIFAIIHIPAVVWGALIEFNSWICPLTPLENRFRIKAGEAGYSGGFIEHYILPVIYIEGLTKEMQITFGIIVVAGNLALYYLILKKWIKTNC